MLDAAYARFLEQGVRATTMDEVAQSAGVTRITVYRRFSTKAELTLAVMMRESQRCLDLLDKAMSRYDSPEDKLVEGFAQSVRFWQTHPLLERLFASEPDSVLPQITLQAAPIHALASRFALPFVKEAQQRGVLRTSDPVITTEVLVRLAQSFILTHAGRIDVSTLPRARKFTREHVIGPLLVTHPSAASERS